MGGIGSGGRRTVKERLKLKARLTELVTSDPDITYPKVGEMLGITYERARQLFLQLHVERPIQRRRALRVERIRELLAKNAYMTRQEIADALSVADDTARLAFKEGGFALRRRPALTYNPANRKQTPEFAAYRNAKAHCDNPNHPEYHGGHVKFLFSSFAEFLADVGRRPEATLPSGKALYRLQRISDDRHFELGNVKWGKSRRTMLSERSHAKEVR